MISIGIQTSPFAYKRPLDPTQELLLAIETCCEEWDDDPAYNDVCFKLQRAHEELEWLCASPARKGAMRQGYYNHAGQEPQHHRNEGLGG